MTVRATQTAISFIGLLVLLLGCATSPGAEVSFREEMTAFMQSASARKLNPALQRRLLTLEEEEGAGAPLNLLLGLRNTPTETEKRQLQEKGLILRSVIGTVATAIAPAHKIPEISQLDFIERIELSRHLQPKGKRD